MQPAACLANKAGILQLPSEREIYFLQWTELWAAGVCAVAPLVVSLTLLYIRLSSLLSSTADAHTCSFIHSFPSSHTHQQPHWRSVMNYSLALQSRNNVGVYMLCRAEDCWHEHDENACLNLKKELNGLCQWFLDVFTHLLQFTHNEYDREPCCRQ